MTARTETNAHLRFGDDDGPGQGFSAESMVTRGNSPEPVVRELLQNCLDAARDAERGCAEVWFTITDIPLANLPGIDDYRVAFEASKAHHAGDPGPDKAVAVERIESVLASDRVRVLYCRDNGIGLDQESLNRVISEGSTDKKTGGGSTGVGHLSAFSASDLRCVFYGGRSRASGALHDAFSGHAVLASHRSPDNPKVGRRASGYWVRRDMESFWAGGENFPDAAPILLADEMDRIDDTGSVVCITGFNSFRDDPAKAVKSLKRVAAAHFCAAIERGEMIIHVCDVDGEKSVVDRDTLGAILEGDKGRTSARAGERISGQQAWRAWRVLDGGRELVDVGVDGVHVWFRPIEDDDGFKDSRVQLCRAGMWITNDRKHLGRFGNCRPFDAVVLVNGGEMYEIVRAAEGPDHIGIEPKRLSTGNGNPRWTRLSKMLVAIQERLRSEAGEIESDDRHTPDNFAIFGGSRVPEAEKVLPLKLRKGIEKGDEVANPGPGDEVVTPDDPPGPPHPPGPPRPPGPSHPHRRLTPRPGGIIPMRYSALPQINGEGEYDTLRVSWKIVEKQGALDEAGVRVRVPSGSDSTCENPLSPQWLGIQAIEHPGGTVYANGDGETELAIPLEDGTLTIMLADTIADPNAVEIEVVRRRRGGGK